MATKRNRQNKTLFCLTDEGVQAQVYLQHENGRIGVYTTYRRTYKGDVKHEGYKGYLLRFLGKLVRSNLPKPPKGRVYHHVAYDFNNPDAHVVCIPNSLHAEIHNSLNIPDWGRTDA